MGRKDRKRIKCHVCKEIMKSDYREAHNRKFHNDLILLRKSIPYTNADERVVENPFAAAASAGRLKRKDPHEESENVMDEEPRAKVAAESEMRSDRRGVEDEDEDLVSETESIIQDSARSANAWSDSDDDEESVASDGDAYFEHSLSECGSEADYCSDEDTNFDTDTPDILGEMNLPAAEAESGIVETNQLPGPKDISQSPDEGPAQPMKDVFPTHLIAGQHRRFSPSFYSRHPWIEYSEISDSIYCFHCRHFAVDPRSEPAFKDEGYRNWKKCYGNESRLKRHERSEAHTNSVAFNTARIAMKNTDQSKRTVFTMMDDAHKKLVEENRHYLRTICEILRLTATQKIAQRETGSMYRVSDNDQENLSYGQHCGNFLAILSLVAKHDPIVASKIQRGPANAKYTHHSVQNALLNIMADMIQQQIRAEISVATYFALLVDESKDVSKKEQISVVLRYLLDGMIHEEFVGTRSATGLDAEILSDCIIELVHGMGVNFDNCIGQGYDGASVMKGHVSGVNVKIKDKVSPLANYIHCFNHRLNLVVVDVLKNVQQAADFFLLIQKMYVFISGSAVHIKWMDIQKKMQLKPMQLKKLSDTRWSCQYGMCRTITKRLEAILNLLEDIEANDLVRDRAYEARCLLGAIDQNFCTLLVCLTEILRHCKAASDFLQSANNSLADAADIVNTMIESLTSLRCNNEYEVLRKRASTMADKHDLHREKRPKRQPKLPSTLESSVVLSTVGKRTATAESFGVDVFFSLLDRCLSELNRRFSEENKTIMKGISALTPGSGSFLNWSLISPFANMYKSNVIDLQLEVRNMERLLARKSNKEYPKGLLEFTIATHRLQDAFYELHRLLTIACVIPVSTASCERSFSTMRVVKNYMRSRMTDPRLKSLMVIGIHAKRAEMLDLHEVLNRFKDIYPNSRILLA